jgi:hypothetical protein
LVLILSLNLNCFYSIILPSDAAEKPDHASVAIALTLLFLAIAQLRDGEDGEDEEDEGVTSPLSVDYCEFSHSGVRRRKLKSAALG